MVSPPSLFPPHANVHIRDHGVVERLRDVVLSEASLPITVDQLGRCLLELLSHPSVSYSAHSLHRSKQLLHPLVDHSTSIFVPEKTPPWSIRRASLRRPTKRRKPACGGVVMIPRQEVSGGWTSSGTGGVRL